MRQSTLGRRRVMTQAVTTDTQHVKFFKAGDGRAVAMLVRAGFDEYGQFPPFIETAAERAHLEKAYTPGTFERERDTKAHLTDDEFPLQVILLNRDPGATTKAHYHSVERHPNLPTRHQVLLCQRGAVRVGVYTLDGEHLADVRLGAGDLILMCEGHEVEFLERGTKLIEIKQGPFPETDERDKVMLR